MIFVINISIYLIIGCKKSRKKKTEKVLSLAKDRKIIRVRDLIKHGIHPEYLRRLCEKGLLIKMGRGIYIPADAEISEKLYNSYQNGKTEQSEQSIKPKTIEIKKDKYTILALMVKDKIITKAEMMARLGV